MWKAISNLLTKKKKKKGEAAATVSAKDSDSDGLEEDGHEAQFSQNYTRQLENVSDLNERVVAGMYGDETFYLPKYLADLRVHQKEGIQFMWMNVIAKMWEDTKDGGKTKNVYGVILAHSMGLGKTLQVVAFVVTMLKNKDLLELPNRKILIVCPASLIYNWKNEFQRWVGDANMADVGRIFVLDKPKEAEKKALINTWHNRGGIFICGYTGFFLFFSSSFFLLVFIHPSPFKTNQPTNQT